MAEKTITTADAKRFLRSYQSILIDIRNMERSLRELEDMAMSITGHVDYVKVKTGTKDADGKDRFELQGMEKVQSSGTQDKMADMVALIADQKQDIMDRRTDAFAALNKVDDVINRVNDPVSRLILHMRYIERQKWEEIAVGIHRDYRWTLRLHGRALDEVRDILQENES